MAWESSREAFIGHQGAERDRLPEYQKIVINSKTFFKTTEK